MAVFYIWICFHVNRIQSLYSHCTEYDVQQQTIVTVVVNSRTLEFF